LQSLVPFNIHYALDFLKKTQKLSKNFIHSLGVFFVSRVFSSIVLFAIGIITARLLNPEGRGNYALFFTATGLVASLTNLGLSQANTYFLNKKKKPLGLMVGNTLLFLFAASFFCIGCIAVLSLFFVESSFGLEGVIPWFLLGLAIIALLWETCFSGLIYGCHLYGLQSRCLAFQALLLLAATLLIIPFGATLESALFWRVGAMVLFAFSYVLFFWMASGGFRPEISIEVFLRQISFGSRNWLQNLIGVLNYRSYILILGVMSGPEAIGFFSVALLFVEAVRFIPDTVGTLLLPRLVNMEVDRDAGEYTALTCRLVLFLVFMIVVFLEILAPWLVSLLFGENYLEVVSVMRILLLGGLFGVVYQVMTRFFTSEAKQSYSIFSALIGLVFAGVISFLLVPRFGVLGAAVAFSLSSLAVAISMLVAFRRHSGTAISKTLTLGPDDWLLIRQGFRDLIALSPFAALSKKS